MDELDLSVGVSHDPDIGRCDDCGSEEGTRRRTLRKITIGGKPHLVVAWLCPFCRGKALAS